jgi:hypothetical protein
MTNFLTENADLVLIFIKVFLVLYLILAGIGVAFRIKKHINDKGLDKSIGFMIYNILGALIFLTAIIFLYIIADGLLSSTV